MITGNVSKSSWLDHYVFLAYIHRRFLRVLSLELFGSILGANYRVTYQDWTCINIEIFCVLSDRCISEFTILSSLPNLARNNYFWMSNPALSPCSHTPQPAVAAGFHSFWSCGFCWILLSCLEVSLSSLVPSAVPIWAYLFSAQCTHKGFPQCLFALAHKYKSIDRLDFCHFRLWSLHFASKWHIK